MGDEKVEPAEGNGCAADGSSRLRNVVTYRRRKKAKFVDYDGMVSKSEKNFTDQGNQKMMHAVLNTSGSFSLKHQRDIVLKQICQSLEIEHSLKKCIQATLTIHPGSVSRTFVKSGPSTIIILRCGQFDWLVWFHKQESVHSCEARNRGTSMQHGLEHAPKSNADMESSVSANGSNHNRNTELCQRTMFDIITSEKFALLCDLFLENGMTAEKLFDLSNINSQMKRKTYETSPILFHADVQQIWTKLQKVGSEMIDLAKFLSEQTLSSFHEQAGRSAQSASNNGKDEFQTLESDMVKADDVAEASSPRELCKCRHCGENTDGRNVLVCDSCEEMYHISCIHPAVKEIPSSSWYCTRCTSNGVESPHDNCVACERLISPFDSNEENHLTRDQMPQKLEASSNGLEQIVRDEKFQHCKVCQTEVKTDEGYQICGHSFCLHKLYHVRCLTSKQLVSYGPCWYCPSCLCQNCFIDQDDDKIVMCDGCDHAHHIYCMQPPQTTIPQGKWFCIICEACLKRLHRAKDIYENTQNSSRKRSLGGGLKAEDTSGVDMLRNNRIVGEMS